MHTQTMPIKNFLYFVLLGFVFLFLPLKPAAAYPRMASDYLNNRLDGCLSKLGCTVTGHKGTIRDRDEPLNPARSATSCHYVRNAIDIVRVSCTNTGTNKNTENLEKLRSCLVGALYTVCYKGKGPCHESHQDVLHFGAKEFFGCR